MRIAADARLLQLEIETLEVDGKGKAKRKTTRCAAPKGMRPEKFPEKRALLLAPGHSYIEEFDPHLVCFGKEGAALAGGAVVRASLGWGPPPKWSKKPPAAPFVVESTDDPAAFAPARGINAPTIVLSHVPPPPAAAGPDEPAKGGAQPPAAGAGPTPPAPAAAPIVDAHAPRLELTAERWADARAPHSVSVSLEAKNAGKRPMTVALRTRMLEFRIEGPGGTVTCPASPPTGGVPRDLFRTLKAGDKSSFKLLLKEMCPDSAFKREGLYRVTATLHANEAGKAQGLDAYTAVIPAKNATIVRLQGAPEPYYDAPPKAVPTPGLSAGPDG
jgi:hypothetical protein